VGDWAQMLVDIEVGDEAAGDAGRRLTSWLVEQRIVAAELTDCVFGAEAGYPPGENYGHAIGKPSAEPGWRRNGVEIHVGRQVYWGADLEAIRCRRCGLECHESVGSRSSSSVATRLHRVTLARSASDYHGNVDLDCPSTPFAIDMRACSASTT
jgi:hypothetical protein